MDKKIRINIQVGEARYPLWVNMEEEPLFREAARMVNRRLVAYTTKFRGAGLTPEAFLAMAAVDLAVSMQRKATDSDVASAETEITQLVDELKRASLPEAE